MKLLLQVLLTTLLGLSNLTALADPPRASHDHWRNTNYYSHYVLYDAATHTYVETVNCRALNRFTLVSNEMNTLYLYDASRGMSMKLDYTGMYLKAAGAQDFTIYQYGTFDTRTMFEHHDQNGAYTGTIVKKHGCSTEEWFPGGQRPSFTFVLTATSNDAVEMYDGSRGIAVKLVGNDMYLRMPNENYSYFKSGQWR